MIRHNVVDFLYEARSSNSNQAAGFQKPQHRMQIEVVCTKIGERIHGNNCIEELGSKRQFASVGVNRNDSVVTSRVSDPLQIL